MKHLALIACVSQDGGLGNHGQLLWRFPADQQFFRQTTLGHPVIMGGKTYRSIGRPLPGRENVVLSRSQAAGNGVIWLQSLAELDAYLQHTDGLKFIIGGASLYTHYLPAAETLYLTEVAATQPADVYFPPFDRQDFTITVLSGGESQGFSYQIKKYQRKLVA